MCFSVKKPPTMRTKRQKDIMNTIQKQEEEEEAEKKGETASNHSLRMQTTTKTHDSVIWFLKMSYMNVISMITFHQQVPP
jgi:mevalonate pyrophosphate decarboxylase